MLKSFEPQKNSLGGASFMSILTDFMEEYNNTQQKDLYAIALWGIVEAFNKIFGDLDNFHQADQSRRSKYLVIIGENAIKSVKAKDFIIASCNGFFMNYLAATKGVERAKLRGQIEQVADVLDGIVRHGALKVRQIGEMEGKAREFLSEEATFRIGSQLVKGAFTERAVVDLSKCVSRDLQTVLQTREDYYWFVIEQYDRFLENKAEIRSLLDGMALFSIEHEGRRSEQSYVGKPNPGVTYMALIRSAVRVWCAATAPTFNPDELSLRVIAIIYSRFRIEHKIAIDMYRLEHASHYRNNCIASGSVRSAERWSEVINAINSKLTVYLSSLDSQAE